MAETEIHDRNVHTEKPTIMIADEPTTALDVTLQKQILDTLNNLKNDLNMSMLLISHDIELIKNTAIIYLS